MLKEKGYTICLNKMCSKLVFALFNTEKDLSPVVLAAGSVRYSRYTMSILGKVSDITAFRLCLKVVRGVSGEDCFIYPERTLYPLC